MGFWINNRISIVLIKSQVRRFTAEITSTFKRQLCAIRATITLLLFGTFHRYKRARRFHNINEIKWKEKKKMPKITIDFWCGLALASNTIRIVFSFVSMRQQLFEIHFIQLTTIHSIPFDNSKSLTENMIILKVAVLMCVIGKMDNKDDTFHELNTNFAIFQRIIHF